MAHSHRIPRRCITEAAAPALFRERQPMYVWVGAVLGARMEVGMGARLSVGLGRGCGRGSGRVRDGAVWACRYVQGEMVGMGMSMGVGARIRTEFERSWLREHDTGPLISSLYPSPTLLLL